MRPKEFIGSKSHEDHGLDSKVPLSFAEMIDLDSINDQDIKDLIIKERVIPVTISIDEGIRPKIIDSCGMTCSFCHNEGTPVASAYSKTTLLPNPRYRGRSDVKGVTIFSPIGKAILDLSVGDSTEVTINNKKIPISITRIRSLSELSA